MTLPLALAGKRVRLVVAYNGGGFAGFASNPGVRTVGGELSDALEQVVGIPLRLTCAGRTDTGVHAWGQVVSFDVDDPAAGGRPVDIGSLAHRITKMCGPEIVVRSAEWVTGDFHARYSARSRIYRYSVLNTAAPDPFAATTSWHVAAPLDLAAMRQASDVLIGEHDFSAFCRRPKLGPEAPPRSLVRRVIDARWVAEGEGRLHFEIEATSFCHQMVRAVVGTLVEVGRGHLRAADVGSLLRSGDRSRVPDLAPARGLCLWEVRY